MKFYKKTLLAAFALVVSSQGLNAKTTLCFKNEWKSPSTIETVELDGGECAGNFSFKQMKEKGWKLKDITITNGKEGLNYTYLLSDEDPIKVDNSIFEKKSKLDTRLKVTKLENVSGDTATINVGNLKVGQSAVIQHNFKNNKSILVANAYVTSSNANSSTLKLEPFLDLKQNALPTSNRKAMNGDYVILNYLYDTSLIIAPTQDSFTEVRAKYPNSNFLHSDLFAAELKYEGQPFPSKQMIQEYAISQNIGTIYFVIENKVFIVDTKTFAILDSDNVLFNISEDGKMPFYTRIDKIEKNILNQILDYKSWEIPLIGKLFSNNEEKTEEEILLEDYIEAGELNVSKDIYNNFYKELLGLKK